MSIERTYTTAQAADIFQVKDYTVREWLRTGQLKGFFINNRWRIEEAEIKRFIQEKSKAGNK
jgi:excisionase family DNA binding protein